MWNIINDCMKFIVDNNDLIFDENVPLELRE